MTNGRFDTWSTWQSVNTTKSQNWMTLVHPLNKSVLNSAHVFILIYGHVIPFNNLWLHCSTFDRLTSCHINILSLQPSFVLQQFVVQPSVSNPLIPSQRQTATSSYSRTSLQPNNLIAQSLIPSLCLTATKLYSPLSNPVIWLRSVSRSLSMSPFWSSTWRSLRWIISRILFSFCVSVFSAFTSSSFCC